MAPTQQNSNGSTCLYNSSSNSSVNTTSSSKSHSTSKTASSYVHSMNSNRMCENQTSAANKLTEMESLLPISSRGLFHEDSFFEESRKHFHEAVKEVLDQWNLKSGHLEDNLTSYRNLREIDLRDDNQAVSVTQDDTSHKVIIDVRDFLNGDIKVKMVDDNELVVEGIIEKEDKGCVSKKSFRRCFVLPDLAKSQDVSSAMSSDGVLTITLPKNNQRKISQIQMNLDTKGYNNNHHNMMNSKTEIENTDKKEIMKNVESHFLLPVTKKGDFFNDSYFESARKDFENAVQQVLNKWGEEETAFDKMTNYRSLRENNLKEENQAISVTEHKDHHKVILDVRDFMEGDVKVKMMDENELKIEGSTEIRKDGSTSRKSFCRSFVFPGLIKADAVTSAMSTDGILTISVPKTSTLNTQQYIQSSFHSKIKDAAKTNRSNLTSENTPENTIKEEKNNRVLESKFDSLLPVSHRGLFFQDDFFESARKEYEKAVQEVLGKSGNNFSLADSMSSYRTLRNTNLMDENQAVSVTEDHQSHKVVMDVRDFMQNDLKVKIVDENELVVEGTLEKKEGGSVSKKSFRRSFVFPGLVNSDGVSSALSSDGVLTITVPKIYRPETNVKTVRFLSDDDISGASQQMSSTKHNHENSLRSSHKSETKKSHDQRSESSEVLASNALNTSQNENKLSNSQIDSFSHDDFFQNARQDFQSVLKKISDDRNKSDFSYDVTDTHNSLIAANGEDNLSLSITEDDAAHKIVVHVGDFVKEGIQVKLVNDNEILVEGHKEIEGDGKSSSKSFSRRVHLPGAVDAVSSTLSKDGILTITAQKNSTNSTSKSQNGSSFLSHSNNNNNNTTISNSHQEQSKEILKNSSLISSISSRSASHHVKSFSHF